MKIIYKRHRDKGITLDKKRPNWLFRILLFFSILAHIFLLRSIARIYQKKHPPYIEFTMQDLTQPPSRNIPRPKKRQKISNTEKVAVINAPKLSKITTTRHTPVKIESIEKGLNEHPTEIINIPHPEIPGSINYRAGNIDTKWLEEINPHDFISKESYLDKVRLKIENRKKYPELAKKRHLEGNVTIRFVITQTGYINEMEVVKPSAHKILDRAALKAIENAAPFPKPPTHLLSEGVILLQLTLIFKLT